MHFLDITFIGHIASLLLKNESVSTKEKCGNKSNERIVRNKAKVKKTISDQNMCAPKRWMSVLFPIKTGFIFKNSFLLQKHH